MLRTGPRRARGRAGDDALRTTEACLSELSIRRADPADVPGVRLLLRACIEDLLRRGIDQWDDVYPSAAQLAADASSGSLYLGRLGGVLAGAFTLDELPEPEYQVVPWRLHHARVAVVHRLMVHPTHQGRGLGKAFMWFAERYASQTGCGVMRLDAFARNPQALRLYRSLGYRDAGEVAFRKGSLRCFEKRLELS